MAESNLEGGSLPDVPYTPHVKPKKEGRVVPPDLSKEPAPDESLPHTTAEPSNYPKLPKGSNEGRVLEYIKPSINPASTSQEVPTPSPIVRVPRQGKLSKKGI